MLRQVRSREWMLEPLESNIIETKKSNTVSFENNKRKVIQITNAMGDRHGEIIALCDDGSIWMLKNIYEDWTRLKDIPQD